jgi:putative ABC transport system ATP-binding protein/macrolide transport system ATP-binding/permease protein/lipoprotein-releasing system ATP-binding protein
MIDVQDLGKIYTTVRGPQVALQDVSLQIETGEFVAICGHSGSGKSTLLALLGGLCQSTSGTISVDGVHLDQLTPQQRADFRGQQIGFVFQFPSLLHNLRAIDNVALPALIRGDLDYATAYANARHELAEVGLAERWDSYPAELSGGQQRRVSIARALINRPPILLADEPTSDLDAEQEREIFTLLLALQKARASTLILVTHNPALSRQADRIIHLRQGRVIQEETGSRATEPASPPVTQARDDRMALLPEQSSPAPAPEIMGSGLSRFVVEFTGWILAAVVGIALVNYVTARWQRQELVAREETRRTVEVLALQKLRADVENVVAEKDARYRISIYLQNSDPEQPLYVMGPSIRAFVQIDGSWQAVPVTAIAQREGTVNKIADKQLFDFVIHADFKKFDELLHGYMHVRLTNSMIVADKASPGSDLFDRTDDYYFYLRPEGISETQIRQANKWREGSLVPRWIPMPAH